MLGRHHEFARLLKITDEPEGYNSTALTPQETKALLDFGNTRLTRADTQRGSPFLAKLSASYLAQFLLTHNAYPFRLAPGNAVRLGDLNSTWAGWTDGLIASIYCNRFVRERPEEAIAFERGIVDGVSRMDRVAFNTALYQHHFSAPIVVRFRWAIINWSTFHLHLKDYLPSSPPPAPPSRSPIRARLQGLMPALLGYREGLEEDDMLRYHLDRFITVHVIPGWSDVDKRRDKEVRWWRCEKVVKVVGPRYRNEGRACVGKTGKEGMKACGRCGSVRYCSEEHQLAHWPVHKLVCFRPRW